VKSSKPILSPDSLTTIAGAILPILQLAILFGAPITPEQKDAIFSAVLALIGYYTAKQNQVL
jgi:ABC-type antimicrobial peptide transport system permease subunit